MSSAPETPILAKPDALLRVPVGLSSPLWGFYAGAAVSGATWWWMTRWARPQNLEALFGHAVALEASAADMAVEAVPDAVAAPAAAPPAFVEPLDEGFEAAGEVIAEAIVAPPTIAEPVGGEAAPVAPVLAAEAAPAPKPKKAGSPKAE